MSDELKRTPYGRCPICGASGIARERRIDGNDRCATGHIYPSKSALVASRNNVDNIIKDLQTQLTAAREEIESMKRGEYICTKCTP